MFCKLHVSVGAFVRASIRSSVRPCFRDRRLMDFRQTFVVIGASWDKDEPIRFWSQLVRGQAWVKVKLSRRRRPTLDAAADLGLAYRHTQRCTNCSLHLEPEV